MAGEVRRRVALYMRVSTDEQAEKGTIQNQRDFLRNYASLFGLDVAAEYEDDGWSGTLPLSDRPAGRQLLDDARAGRFSEIVIYRLDRLARKLTVLLDAHGALDSVNCSVRSATEPFDTSTPVGRLLFQLLGAIAEWERASISERMTGGRNRVARQGKWTGGPIPLGYDIDDKGHLVPSARPVDGLGINEAELAVDLFQRIAAGSSTMAEAKRLNLMGVTPTKRYSSGKNNHHADDWHPSVIRRIIRNDLYKGMQLVASVQGPVERPVPPLVSEALWHAAGQQLVKNRRMSPKNATRQYLLRGLITCGNCGYTYVGNVRRHKDGGFGDYYRCNYLVGHFTGKEHQRCIGRTVKTAQLDGYVWNEICELVWHPEDAIAEAQAELLARVEQGAGLEQQRRTLQQQIAAKDKERDRILTLYRRGHISLGDVEQQIAAVGREATELRQMADAIRAQDEITQALESQLSDVTRLLTDLRREIVHIEQTNDFDGKRRVVELFVRGITVRTEVLENGRKAARVALRFALGSPRPIVVDGHIDKPIPNYSTLVLGREIVFA